MVALLGEKFENSIQVKTLIGIELLIEFEMTFSGREKKTEKQCSKLNTIRISRVPTVGITNASLFIGIKPITNDKFYH